jgi:hypothetical protein
LQRRKAASGKFILTESYGGGSDHLALIAAFEGWRAAKSSGCEKEFCDRFFINGSTMNMLQVRQEEKEWEKMYLSLSGLVHWSHTSWARYGCLCIIVDYPCHIENLSAILRSVDGIGMGDAIGDGNIEVGFVKVTR